MKYMIHTCPQREWYVNDYLIPSMQEQGIRGITVHVDTEGRGCLWSFIDSITFIDDDAWHLQDDIVISSRFGELTEKHDNGVVCGFCNTYSRYHNISGYTDTLRMWYSFPCIRIPSEILMAFYAWFRSDTVQSQYKHYISKGKYVDLLFREFMRKQYPMERVLNLSPNIVNHVDHLLGGSIINNDRVDAIEDVMAIYWDEPQLIEQLAERLRNERDTDSKSDDI